MNQPLTIEFAFNVLNSVNPALKLVQLTVLLRDTYNLSKIEAYNEYANMISLFIETYPGIGYKRICQTRLDGWILNQLEETPL